uniref:Uncharacterized protein n=1 Tax=Globodera rostochiensis TaxID=31243 RepID=A0A914GUV6_GLORO
MLLSCTVTVVLTALLPVVTSVTEAAKTESAATGSHLNHRDETEAAATGNHLNHRDETGTAATGNHLNHRDETGTASTGNHLNHRDETGTASTGNHLNHRDETGTASTGNHLNHRDETGTAATGNHLNHRDETGTAATGNHLNHRDETGTAATGNHLNHRDETGTAATGNHLNHRDETGTAATGNHLNHRDETGTAATGNHLNHRDETGTAATGNHLNHRDETGTAATGNHLNHRDETGTAATGNHLNHRDETGTAATGNHLNHRDETGTAATGNHLNHRDETGTAAHRLPTTASTSLGHLVDAGFDHRLPTSPFVGHADDQTVGNLMEETPSSAPTDDENIDEYRMTPPTIKPMDNGTVKREKRNWMSLAKVGWAVVQQAIPGATSWFCQKRAEHCYCGHGRCVDRNTYKKADVCCHDGREYACCPDEPTTPAPNLEDCPIVEHEELKKVCPWVTAVFPGTAGTCRMESPETHKFVCECPSLLGGSAQQRGVCVQDCKILNAEMVCDCGWGNCEEPWRIKDTSVYLWTCGCCASRPLFFQIYLDKVICVETKEVVAPTDETIMATTEVIPTDEAVNETKLDWGQCQKLAQQHCLCGWATCRQREKGYNASLCCAAGYELQCCYSDDSERTVVNPLQCRVAHRINFGQDIQVEYSTTGCDAASHFCYMAHCHKRDDPRVSYTEWGCKQNKTECGVKERLGTWMGRDLVNAISASIEDMECSDCHKGPEAISMSNEKMTPPENLPKADKLLATNASSIKVRCTTNHRCFPLFLERGELSKTSFKFKGQYVVRRPQSEAVHAHCDHKVTLLCKVAAGFLTDFIFDEFFTQTPKGAFLNEYTKVRASC